MGPPSGRAAELGADAARLAAERRALLMLVASSTAFGVMAFCAKLASQRGVGGAEVAAMRFAFGLLPVLLSPRLRRRALTWQRRDLLLYRGFFGGIAVLLYFLSIDHVPVGLATLLNYTSPVFAAVFAALFIGEPVQPRVLPALGIALGGVFLVVRAHGGDGGIGAVGPWAVVGLASAALSGAAVTAIRMARRTEGSWAIYTSFNALGLLATAPFALAAWRHPGVVGWLALVGVGALSMVAQLLMTYAFRWIDNLRAGVVQQLAVFVAMTMGALFLGEPVTAQSLLGSLLTVAGVVAVVAFRGRRVAAEEVEAG
ncbi:MAG TPA: DMT family transporter [Thermoanaerobaculia bacterium]|nr:DMT family transporter [Thermoanaerobaculia bacterium]